MVSKARLQCMEKGKLNLIQAQTILYLIGFEMTTV